MFKLRKRKNKTSAREVDGVFFDKRRRVVAIKKGTVTLEMKRSLLRFLWVCVISGAALISAGFYIFGSAFRTHAETLLYPQTCLGGWNHSEKASGVPEVMGHAQEEYTDDNSASVSNALAQIFCGGFSGDIPANTSPTKIVVQFSWAVKALAPQASPITIFPSENFSSSTIQIIDVPADVPAKLLIPISTNQSSSSTPENPNLSSPTETSSSTPTPIPDTPQPPNPVSFLWRLVQPQRALAQEMATTSSGGNATSSPVSTPTGDALLEVLYTLDGTTWQTLGTATRETLATAVFEIPLTSISSWKDLSQLQISVRSLSNVDTATTVYLDGMEIKVDYSNDQVPDVTATSTTPLLSNGSTFTESELLSVIVRSARNDNSTNIAFYMKCPSVSCPNYGTAKSPVFVFSAENVGHGALPFSEYWAPPGPNEYVAVEYVNDAQQFTCSDLSLKDCLADPHFIRRIDFKVTPDASSSDTIPTPQAI